MPQFLPFYSEFHSTAHWLAMSSITGDSLLVSFSIARDTGLFVKPFNVLTFYHHHKPHWAIPEESRPWRVGRLTSRRLREVLRDIGIPGLLELAECLGPQVFLPHFILEGSRRQTCHVDSKSGCVPSPCHLHFSPIGEREKPVSDVDDVEKEMGHQLDKRWAVKDTILLNIRWYLSILLNITEK